jgi:glycosyltransferase involved in cell wall biosynthesis
MSNAGALSRVGCLYTSSIINSSQLWLREVHGARSWSLCGVNHTLSSARVMDAVTGLLTSPVQPWDALICTSNASKDVIQRLIDRQAEFLASRLGATRFVTPQLPVIPLGVDCDAQQRRSGQREPSRAVLGIGADDVVVLFLGRLSFHAKANPIPMYIALERIAKGMGKDRKVVLIECGWLPNDAVAKAFSDSRGLLCPTVRSLVLDGRDPEARTQAWAAADIFCSLSDNIQETFGLTPIEAMAAGLPVVVTDWDGYKDTVRDGVDGFAVPTVFAPPGAGAAAALRHAVELDTYDLYIAQIAATTTVDVDATTRAFEKLVDDPELRRRMGANGAARAREAFDWKVVIKAYEALWAELAEMREAGEGQAGRRATGVWPARPDPFDLFASFPTSVISARHKISRPDDVDDREAAARIALRAAMANLVPEISPPLVMDLWRRLGTGDQTVEAILATEDRMPGAATLRALLLLAKLGLVAIHGD